MIRQEFEAEAEAQEMQNPPKPDDTGKPPPQQSQGQGQDGEGEQGEPSEGGNQVSSSFPGKVLLPILPCRASFTHVLLFVCSFD